MALPTLVAISGPSGGYGKTTLAHELAQALGCPAICRDEIKEGMVHANPGFRPGRGDPLTRRTLPAFFGVLELLVRSGTTVVAEAAFHDRLWRPGLQPLMGLAHLRIIRCTVAPDVARARNAQRYTANPVRKAAHTTSAHQHAPGREEDFAGITLPAPTLLVDTTDGFEPPMPEILSFVDARPHTQP
ncbi:AAA family ATPase [Actinopolymorpha rutila]|uniref:Putative kinase n=1 Tax=Actinopolymorpha rutila TaxID=446787 RepID=A0A852ZCC5_9ACTN|nr:AAA family ATPase [Actinopolymorpha rutila]NYH90761.1 putative kinase [Actinopolymorpha rutila]